MKMKDLRKLDKKLARWHELELEEKILSAERAAIKKEILAALGTDTEGEGKYFVVQYGEQTRRIFQGGVFKKENPGLWDKYAKDSVSTFFKVSKKD